MPITIITLYNGSTKQYYVAIRNGILENEDKEKMCKAMNAEPACIFPYGLEPRTINLLYFQEFEENDSQGIFYNINGDRPIYEVIHMGRRYFPEYTI